MTVREHLNIIALNVNAIGEKCDEYGGWAGDDEDAKPAADLGYELLSMAWAVAMHGREYAESGVVPSSEERQ